MKTPLYEVLCASIKTIRGLRWVFDPDTGLYFIADFMRDRIGLRNNECYVDEVRGWVVSFDEDMDECIRQLRTMDHYNVISTVRLSDGTIEKWSGHGRFVTCVRDMPAVCTPACPTPKCRIIVGASEVLTSTEPLRHSRLQRPDH
jgi:hypothetical protein